MGIVRDIFFIIIFFLSFFFVFAEFEEMSGVWRDEF